MASRSCVAWSWCAQASIHNPAFSISSSAQCSTYSSTSAIGKHPLDGPLAINQVRHYSPPRAASVTDRSGKLSPLVA